MSSAANEAAAGLTGELVTELVGKVPPADADYDQLGAEVAELHQSVEAPQASSEEAAVAQTVEQETAVENELDLPNYTPEIPDDLLEELDEPDFEDEAATEVSSDEEEYVEGYDSEERTRRIAAEKRAAWLEGRLQAQNRGKWEAEATKYFPLAEHAIKDITADSRRAFLREAKKAHEAVLPYVKPLIERLGEATEQAKEQAKQEGRSEAQAAWGSPTTGPGVVPVTTSAKTAELESARKTGNLQKIIHVLMNQGGE